MSKGGGLHTQDQQEKWDWWVLLLELAHSSGCFSLGYDKTFFFVFTRLDRWVLWTSFLFVCLIRVPITVDSGLYNTHERIDICKRRKDQQIQVGVCFGFALFSWIREGSVRTYKRETSLYEGIEREPVLLHYRSPCCVTPACSVAFSWSTSLPLFCSSGTKNVRWIQRFF